MERFSTNVCFGLFKAYTVMKLLILYCCAILVWYFYNMLMMKDYPLWPAGVIAFTFALFPCIIVVFLFFNICKGPRRLASRS